MTINTMNKLKFASVVLMLLAATVIFSPKRTFADTTCSNGKVVAIASQCPEASGSTSTSTDTTPEVLKGTQPIQVPNNEGTHQCGKGENNIVMTGFDFGCIGKNYSGQNLNPIIDIAFAIFRFLSAGVGVVVVASVIVAGIQYSTARNNPQSVMNAQKRIANSLLALVFYVFTFAIANFLVPGGMFIK